MFEMLQANETPPSAHHYHPNALEPHYCEFHQYAQKYYCETCCTPFCPDCDFRLHADHLVVPILEAAHQADEQCTLTIIEAQNGIDTLRDELTTVVVSWMMQRRTQNNG